ncbi:MAG: hypothetical protein L6R48_15220, partial [Planctomycetes bacterium]|nr:hypothetical protein [Planctomycetota bacterium]
AAVAAARFQAPAEGGLLLGLAADYFAQVRLNGAVVAAFTGGHGGSLTHAFFPVQVRAGWNELVVTALPGSRGFACDLLLERPAAGALSWETE